MFYRRIIKEASITKKLIQGSGIKTSSKLFNNECFIFNFDDIENLKKLKERNTESFVAQIETNKEKYEQVLDKNKLKKTRKLFKFIQKKLSTYEETPLNKFFFIFYKNVDCLAEVEVIDLLYLAVKNKKFYAQQRDISQNYDNEDVNRWDVSIFGENDLTKNQIEDISDHIGTYSDEVNECNINFLKDKKLGDKNERSSPNEGILDWKDYAHNKSSYFKYPSGVTTRLDTTNCEVAIVKNNTTNCYTLGEEERVEDIKNYNSIHRNGNIKKINVDYVLRLLSSFKDSLRKGKSGKWNMINLLDVYKLSYCLRYYKMVEEDNFITSYICAFLKKEIYYINQKSKKYEIQNDEQLNILLNILIIHYKNLKGYFFNLLYDYLFSVLKSNIFNLSTKNICLLFHVNNFEMNKYDPFFFFLLRGKKAPSPTPSLVLTMADVNYLLFYQLKNGTVWSIPSLDHLIKYLAHSSEISSEKQQNIFLLSLLLLQYEYSKKYSCDSYDKYVEIIYHMYSYLMKNLKIFLENKEKRETSLNIPFLTTFSLGLYLIRNNLHFNNEFYLFLLYLITNSAQTMIIHDYIALLNFIQFYKIKNEFYYSRNSLYYEDKRCFYMYDHEMRNQHRYLPLNWEQLSRYIYECLKVIYSFEEKKYNQLCLSEGALKGTNEIVCSTGNSRIRNYSVHKDVFVMDNDKEAHITKPILVGTDASKAHAYELAINSNTETYLLKKQKLRDPEKDKTENVFRMKIPVQCINKQKTSKKNKSYYLHIMDILPSVQNSFNDNNFYKYLMNLFHRGVFNFNLHIFDLDKILFTYSILNLKKEEISLNILSLVDKVKTNFMNKKKYSFEEEKYIFHSISNILLSITELNLSTVVDLEFFEKQILTNIHKLNINGILILLQYYILKGAMMTVSPLYTHHINTVTFLVIHYIKKKYLVEQDGANINACQLDKLKDDVNYHIIRRYLHQSENQNNQGVPGEKNQMWKKIDRKINYSNDVVRKDVNPCIGIEIDAIKNNNNVYNNTTFKKIDEDDLYEFLLLKFAFIYIITHSSLFHDQFKYYYGLEEHYRIFMNNLSRIVLHLKTDFSEMLFVNLMDYNVAMNIHGMCKSNGANHGGQENIKRNKEESACRKLDSCLAPQDAAKEVESKNREINEEEHVAINEAEHVAINEVEHVVIGKSERGGVDKNKHILSKTDFRLLMNYLTFIFKHDLNFVTSDQYLIESMKMQHLFVKKFKSLYYNYKYAFVYRKLMLSLIFNMKKRNSIRMNCLLKGFNRSGTSDMEKININEYIKILRFFNNLCEEKGLKGNIFFSYLKKNGIQICSSGESHQYDIILNRHLIYDINSSEIANIQLNVPFFNYIIPMLIETKRFSIVVQAIFNPCENVDTYVVLFNVMRAFLKSYNYHVILMKRKTDA
ncbi:hypothetical protein, conserved [Plasmodium gonderi]|uniref:Uncharacterized protein n=1 Tax=Plasmodium gonderi TaxID=77519 RepID=A0A1Y1J8Q3_PLAGO|nr:hypothetical protein, conserved [Plasmodium gonderi]GAW78891.1 hypothetical protein, conserved [Plasmodium gonderi]